MGLTTSSFKQEIDIAQVCPKCKKGFPLTVTRDDMVAEKVYKVICPACQHEWEYKETKIEGKNL